MAVEDALAGTDSFVAAIAGVVADRMTAAGLPGGGLRERIHLDPFTKDEVERRVGVRPLSRTLRTSNFPGLGPVDVVVAEPRALIELKWAYQSPGKIFESVWDAIKLALLGPTHSYRALYLGTGAARDEWAASESADLFEAGEIEPREIWRRPLLPPRGPNYGKTVGDDLVIGAGGNRPLRVHRRILIRPVARCDVTGHFELRVIGVTGLGPLEDWGDIASQVQPREPSELIHSVELPARVTQAWIERTAPRLTAAAIAPFLHALRQRGWSDSELAQRVVPHLPDS